MNAANKKGMVESSIFPCGLIIVGSSLNANITLDGGLGFCKVEVC